MDSGGIGQAVASSFNQHPPQFMNTVEDLQKSGAIDPVVTYMHSYVYLSPHFMRLTLTRLRIVESAADEFGGRQRRILQPSEE